MVILKSFFLNGVALLDKPAVAPTCRSVITFENCYMILYMMWSGRFSFHSLVLCFLADHAADLRKANLLIMRHHLLGGVCSTSLKFFPNGTFPSSRRTPGPSSSWIPVFTLKCLPFLQQVLEIWCHGCAEGSSVLGRVSRDVCGTTFPCWRGIRRPSSSNREARMNPAGRDASVAPDPVAALSCSVVTDRPCLFAGMTGVHDRKSFSRIALNLVRAEWCN